jgi:ATP-dependent exoDNAse (exonuclease V) beta subunit
VKKELQPLLPAQFQEMFVVHTTQVVNESLCLLYVAMTRAVHALYMIIAPSRPNEKTIPKTFAGIVRTALCGEARAAPETVLYEHGMPDWQQQTRQTDTHRAYAHMQRSAREGWSAYVPLMWQRDQSSTSLTGYGLVPYRQWHGVHSYTHG